MNSDLVLQISNLSLEYWIFQRDLKSLLTSFVKRKSLSTRIPVFENISTEIRKGEIVALMGPNGTGKSSLLYAICGKMPITNGKVETYGKIIAYLGNYTGLTGIHTGIETLRQLAALHGTSPSIIDRNLEKISASSGLPIELIRNRQMYTYSKGMTSRLNSSLSLVIRGSLNIFDETIEAGDLNFRDNLFLSIEKNLGSGSSYLIASHSVSTWEKIRQLGGRFLVLGNRTLLYDGRDLDKAKKLYDDNPNFVSQRIEPPLLDDEKVAV